jgi:hypothetical protein
LYLERRVKATFSCLFFFYYFRALAVLNNPTQEKRRSCIALRCVIYSAGPPHSAPWLEYVYVLRHSQTTAHFFITLTMNFFARVPSHPLAMTYLTTSLR